MNTLFDDLQEGLHQAIDFANGTGPAKVTKYKIEPVTELSKDQIREVRMNAHMTQVVFASFLGVSVKTVEAWECGRTHPTGPAYRLMDLLANRQAESLPFLSVD